MSEKNNMLPIAAAFLAGVAVAAIVAFIMFGQKGATAQKESQVQAESNPSEASVPESAVSDASQSVQPESAASDASQTTQPVSAASGKEDIDYAKTFPSWNPDSRSLGELVDFVAGVTDQSNPEYLEPADRIATFDMDGTILC